jgi:thymidylate synthase ThyX
MNNTVELLGFYGSDEVIACSAWTSTSRELTEEKKQRIPALITHLWLNGHETPFEKATVHFLVDCDIASHIHLLKHRIASINAESARYKELQEDKFYLPEDWNKINTLISNDGDNYGNAGAYFHGCKDWKQILGSYTQLGNQLYHQCLHLY